MTETAWRAAIDRLPPVGSLSSSVVLLHGYAAHAGVHHADARAFVDEHTEVVIPDAPGHGRRDDGRLERIAELTGDARRRAVLEIASEWRDELPELAAWCRSRGAARVGLVGISMGGFAALGALTPGSGTSHRVPNPFAAIAAVLAGPGLVDIDALPSIRPPLLLGIASRDEAVPPAPSREFARNHGAELHEYAESGHFMRGEDWTDLWARTAAFLRRHSAT